LTFLRVDTTAKPWPLSAAVLSRSVQRNQRAMHSPEIVHGGSMPLIKPRTRGKQLVRHIARLDRETNETLFAYAHFIGEPTDYVLNQVIDTVLGKDKDFQGWRTEHRESFVPRPGSKSHRPRRTTETEPMRQGSTVELGPVAVARA
jgi:hypothetical protein